MIRALFLVLALVQEPTFRTQAPLVVVPVSVTTKSGERIWDLGQDDFRLLDNGRERAVKVEPWGTYQARISLAVVVETNQISATALLKVKKVGGMLDSILGEGGEAALITTDSAVGMRAKFNARWENLQEAFEDLKPAGGGGRILDGVAAAIDLLATCAPERRRIILLLSEAHDRGSKSTAEDVLTRAQRENVTIYAVNYSVYATTWTTKASEIGPDPWHGISLPQLLADLARSSKEGVGVTLARYTGGRQLSFAVLKRLEDDLAAVGKEVHSQYLLTFTPDAEREPVFHSLSVSIKGHADAVVVARPGYWNRGSSH